MYTATKTADVKIEYIVTNDNIYTYVIKEHGV
jgi:hypothetical protein